MRRLLLIVLALLCVVPLYILAQPPHAVQRTPEQEAAKQTEMMKRDLALLPEQVDTIYALNLKYALLRRTSHSREEWATYLKQKDIDLQSILTAEQYEEHLQRKHKRHHTHSVPCVFKQPSDTLSAAKIHN